ncbi:hypothetical protein B0H13DRAFT_1901668 [Mycena leptocephala]|nr:hypothetical protein B0H13DRAFT_1901668 [Mycena leptocephala]
MSYPQMYPQMREQAGWDPAHAEHTGHASVTFLRAISEFEETESFVLAPAIISGMRCPATAVDQEGGKRIPKPVGTGILQAEMVYKACSLSHIQSSISGHAAVLVSIVFRRFSTGLWAVSGSRVACLSLSCGKWFTIHLGGRLSSSSVEPGRDRCV